VNTPLPGTKFRHGVGGAATAVVRPPGSREQP
jgi:hypothetical protein